ncbi:MAG: energy transducer TonB [Reyranella sp.]
MRATTTTRIPPLALAAAAGLHVLVGIAVLDLWQRSLAFDEPLPFEIEVAMPAAPSQPETEREPTAEPVTAAAEPEPEPPPPEPEIAAFDPTFIPEPEPPPPLVLEQPKPALPTPTPPKPPPPKPAALPRPPAAITATAPPAPAVSAPAPAPATPRHDPSYLDRLATAIERERDYPAHARRQGHQGRVVVHLVIAASGKLLAAHVGTSSGLETLDRAALGMVQRARLPPFGPGFGAESATFTVPIAFAMR